MVQVLTDSSTCLYLVVQPEKVAAPFAVSLWATWAAGSETGTMASTPGSWHDFARLLEHAGLMDSSDLGWVDAHVGRGEPIIRSLSCSVADLEAIGLGEVHKLDDRGVPDSIVTLQRELADGAVVAAEGQLPTNKPSPTAFSSQIALLGVRINNVSMPEAISMIDSLIDRGGFHQIATANVDFLNKAAEERELMEILHRCELVLADGMPLVWASRLMGTPLKERVTGADLVPLLMELSARKKRRIFLLGSTEERSQSALRRICREYPEAEICGRLSPPFTSLDEMQHEEILKQIEESAPDILLVAFGNPKQEKWLARHRDRLKVPVCIGVGGAIDFLSEEQPRAPRWMQGLGMEWIFRFLSEPKRLGPRYLEDAMFLLRFLSMQILTTSVQARKTSTTVVSTTRKEGVLIVRIAGTFGGSAVARLEQSLEPELADGVSIVMDLSSTSSIWPDAAGLLADLTRKAIYTDAQVWLVGVQRGVREVLRRTFPTGHYFRNAATVEDAIQLLCSDDQTRAALQTPTHDSALESRIEPWKASLNLYQWE